MFFSLKKYIVGFAVFLIPIVSFISKNGFEPLSTFDLYLIFISLVVVLIVLIIFSFFFEYVILIFFKKKHHSIFLLSCFGFYLLFLFQPIHEIVMITIFQKGGATYFTLLSLLLIWLFITSLVLFFEKFAALFQRGIFIFACMIICFSLMINTDFLKKISNNSFVLQKQKHNLFKFQNSELLKSLHNKSDIHNVYFVILDEMIGLEYAAKMNIVNALKQKKALANAGLIYIDQSYSNYSSSRHTLTSIMKANLVDDEDSLFPAMMRQNDKLVPLPELVRKTGSEFVWMGNYLSICAEWYPQPWSCINISKSKYFTRLSSTIYLGTPLQKILELTNIATGQRNLKHYMEHSKKRKKNNNIQFVFIHQMSPHDPYTVNEDCNPREVGLKKLDWEEEYKGYKGAYRCVLKEVLEFTEYISILDPEAIIVFQGDHGLWVTGDQSKTPQDKINYRASVFNAIKAPETCFKKFGKPSSNINTVRFILNCAYGYKLSYLPLIHYRFIDSQNAERFQKFYTSLMKP